MLSLKDEYALRAYYFWKGSYADLASALGVSESGARVRVHRARRRLKQYLQ